MNIIYIVTLLILLFPFSVEAKETFRVVEGIVIKVTDGDTIQVKNSQGTRLKIRLYGIDAPETEKSNRRTGYISKPGQPFGEESWKVLEEKVNRKMTRLDVVDIDKYKRLVCLVWLSDRNINKEMVEEGWAWAYRKYLETPYASEFIDLEGRARAKKLGLWQQHNPQPPWEFRKSSRKDALFWGNP